MKDPKVCEACGHEGDVHLTQFGGVYCDNGIECGYRCMALEKKRTRTRVRK